MNDSLRRDALLLERAPPFASSADAHASAHVKTPHFDMHASIIRRDLSEQSVLSRQGPLAEAPLRCLAACRRRRPPAPPRSSRSGPLADLRPPTGSCCAGHAPPRASRHSNLPRASARRRMELLSARVRPPLTTRSDCASWVGVALTEALQDGQQRAAISGHARRRFSGAHDAALAP